MLYQGWFKVPPLCCHRRIWGIVGFSVCRHLSLYILQKGPSGFQNQPALHTFPPLASHPATLAWRLELSILSLFSPPYAASTRPTLEASSKEVAWSRCAVEGVEAREIQRCAYRANLLSGPMVVMVGGGGGGTGSSLPSPPRTASISGARVSAWTPRLWPRPPTSSPPRRAHPGTRLGAVSVQARGLNTAAPVTLHHWLMGGMLLYDYSSPPFLFHSSQIHLSPSSLFSFGSGEI
jgi:hypothetical protein